MPTKGAGAMLYDVPTPLLIALLLLLMAGAVEAGLPLGRRFGRTTWTDAKEILTGLSAASLALLGLMLAFTFSLAAGRHDARQNALVEESNAILVVSHLLDYLVPLARSETEDLLRRYAEARIAYLAVGHDIPREAGAIDRSRELGEALWSLARATDNYTATAAALRGQTTQLTGALLELFVASREREEARARRVPQAVVAMLLAMAVLAVGMVAYMAGASHAPDRPKLYVFVLFIGMVIYLIVDLDRPRRGLMQISPGPLEAALAIISRAH